MKKKEISNTPKLKDVSLDELKNFIEEIKKEQATDKKFQPERLQYMRLGGSKGKYSSGLSN